MLEERIFHDVEDEVSIDVTTSKDLQGERSVVVRFTMKRTYVWTRPPRIYPQQVRHDPGT